MVFEPLKGTLGVGPRVMLVCGYSARDVKRLEGIAKDIGVSVKVFCKEMLKVKVSEALNMECGGFFDEKLPRVILLSGLNGKEVSRAMDLLREIDIEPPIFAVTTRININMTLGELLKELIKEYIEFAKGRGKG